VVRTRAFNHCGPGQSAEYVVGSLTRQLAVAELAGKRAVTLRVGALDVSRDFTDVRDVVRAYLMAAGLDPAAYNVCSGCSVSVRDLIERLRDCTDLEVSASTDAELLRPVDATEVRGAPDRLAAATGWSPEVPLERSVRDAVDAWRARLQSQ
jgi:GDP-4-dehydro-6-deoxy-D-mannose reductase